MLARKVTCVIVDDEPIARIGLVKYIGMVEQLELIGECRDVAELEALLSKRKPDMMFLDIEMPGKTGISFLEEVDDAPLVVITSAYSQFGAKSYDLNVVDYLVKPFPPARFKAAVEKVFDLIEFRSSRQENFIFIREKRALLKINLDEVIYIEALENYVVFVTRHKKHIVHQTLASSLAMVSQSSFYQVHRSYIVNCRHVNRVTHDEIVASEKHIPLSKKYRKEFLEGYSALK